MVAGTVAPGQLIAGRYRLQEELGRGGMAIVYRAHDEQLQRDVALKLIDDRQAADEKFIADFVAEARAAAATPDRNVVTIFDAGEHEGRPFFVMEHVDGGDLHALLRQRGRLEPLEAARIAHGIARGLAVVHARGMVHCDVKPLNVLLSSDGQPKLVDFGIACVAADMTTDYSSDEIVGSAPYLSPEQVRGERIDSRTDVYALGILLYELLAGRPPFVGRNVAEVATQRLNTAPRPIREVAPDTPAPLAAVVERALAIDRADRYADGAAVAEALAPIVDGRGGGQGEASAVHGQTTRVIPLAVAPAARRAAPNGSPPARQHASAGAVAALAGRLPGRVWLLLGLLLATALLIGRVATAGFGGILTEQIEVPPLAGMKFEEAAQKLQAIGLEPERIDEVTLDTPRGLVVTQEPAAGKNTPKGSKVRLNVSQGIAVPNLVGQHWDNVKPWLDQNGWRVGRLRFVFADYKDFGKVLSQDPVPGAGTVADKAGTPINLNIAGPPEATKTGFQTAPATPPQAAPARAEPPRAPAKPEKRRNDSGGDDDD